MPVEITWVSSWNPPEWTWLTGKEPKLNGISQRSPCLMTRYKLRVGIHMKSHDIQWNHQLNPAKSPWNQYFLLVKAIWTQQKKKTHLAHAPGCFQRCGLCVTPRGLGRLASTGNMFFFRNDGEVKQEYFFYGSLRYCGWLRNPAPVDRWCTSHYL